MEFRRPWFFLMLSALTVAALAPALALASPFESADPSKIGPEGNLLTVMPPLDFSVDDRLKRNLNFWIRIYTEYSTYQGIIHDAKYVDKIYEIIDFRTYSRKSSRVARDAKRHWHDVLMAVHRKQKHPETMNQDEKHVFDLFADVNEPNKFLAAAHRKRLRFQLGQRDRFLEGYYESGRYLPAMEAIFKREGMPVELTRLPFVESSFNLKARSKVGASGIWQFMRSTGKLFIKVNDAIDERNDPLRATEAAARLLRVNYESLGNWPLAVTAYNHGRKGMMRAVRRVGSEDLEDLVEDYHSRSFGFASSNFFTELLAAIQVEKDADHYFGKIERGKPIRYVEVTLPDFVDVRDLARYLKLDLDTLKDYNPALLDTIFHGYRLIPAGYALRLPYDGPDSTEGREAARKLFLAGYDALPATMKKAHQLTTRLPASFERRFGRKYANRSRKAKKGARRGRHQ